jgi:hypothetical protein
MKKLLESGALGVGTAALAKNPEMLRGFGLLGNVAANKMDDREEKKKAAAAGAPAMKRGGSVSSASKRADGVAMKGKTKGRIV